MGQHKTTIHWERDTEHFNIKSFNRSHRIHFPNGALLEGSSAPDYSGDPEKNNPEQLFVASLSSCHMLTFLAVAAIGKWKVESYEDDAVGYLEKNETGKMSMNRFVLRPSVRFSGEGPNQEELSKLQEKAHRGCFIVSSVNTEVRIEPPSV